MCFRYCFESYVLPQVPNVTVAEINIELEFQMTFVLEYDASANVWGTPRKAKVCPLCLVNHMPEACSSNAMFVPGDTEM